MSLVDDFSAALARPARAPLLTDDLPDERAKATIKAAVLVAITDQRKPGMILTVRRDDMRTHGGQVASQAAEPTPARAPSRPRCAKRRRSLRSIRHRSRSQEPSNPIAR